MRKLHIIQTIIIATLTAATIYFYQQGERLYQAQQYKPTPKVSAQAIPDTEKQHLQDTICWLQSENEILKQENKNLNWYMDTFFSPAQREYMRRGKE